MKKILILLVIIITNSSIYAQCPPNGGLEYGNLTNWQAFTGMNTGGVNFINLNNFTQGADPQRHVIENATLPDPAINLPTFKKGITGLYSVRLGNAIAGSQAEILSYTFTVNSSNEQFAFHHAAVMQNANHLTNPLNPGNVLNTYPFFEYWISTTNNLAASTNPTNLVLAPQRIIFNPADGIFTIPENSPDGSIGYYKWNQRCHDLSAYANQQVTIFFLNADCSQNGHWGYSYIDGLCASSDQPPVANITCPSFICDVTPYRVDGTQSTNYDRYEWTLTNLSTGDIATNSDYGLMGYDNYVKYQYILQYGKMPPGQYELRLKVWNCNSYDEDICIITLVEPLSFTTENAYGCCSPPNDPINNLSIAAKVVISNTSNIGIFEWYDEQGVFVGNGVTTQTPSGTDVVLDNVFIVNGVTSYKKYKVIYKDPLSGCEYEEWAAAVKIPDVDNFWINESCPNGICGPRQLQIQHRDGLLCSSDMTVDWRDLIEQSYTYSWNTGETTEYITPTSNVTNYSCTITSPCSTATVTHTVPPNRFHGQFNFTYTPLVGGYTGNFIIWDPTLPLTALAEAYNATEYKLEIRDRWGALMYSQQGSANCAGFRNELIRWDLINNNASPPAPITETAPFFFYIDFGNCDTPLGGDPEFSGDFTVIF